MATAHSGHYVGTGAKTTAKGGYGVGTVFNYRSIPSPRSFASTSARSMA